MSTHRYIDRICCAAVAIALIITVIFMNGAVLGIESVKKTMGYESRLFDTAKVHTIEIIMDDWDSFIETCENEEYTMCTAVIDNEAYKNIGIRAKGNTSLSNVSSMNSERYSFKIEFDKYDSSGTYYGLDKLSLNNIIQDNTYMKDYLVYRMMGEFGVSAPLCSFVYITVNGEDWGLYLAVEGVENGFLERNYGSDYGELYKPDSMSFGGGRGNGADFKMDEFDFENSDEAAIPEMPEQSSDGQMDSAEQSGGFGARGQGGRGQGGMPFDFSGEMPDFENSEMPDFGNGEMPDFGNGEMPDFENGEMPEMPSGEIPEGFENGAEQFGGGKGGMGGGMGSSDVKLQYSDDDFSSYSNIFNNAKTDVTDADKTRLIESLKTLSGEDAAQAVDVEAVIRYFVIHNFVCNFDSYTGSMIHNYYLYEKDGLLSMIPWDYNLAFGAFQGASDATSLVNYPIDSPVSGGSVEDRPMIAWIFASEEYTEQYHSLMQEMITRYFSDGYIESMIDSTAQLIAPYVEKDPSKFCTYEEFEEGVAALKEFCALRAESVSGQLDGSIPSTSEAQAENGTALVDAGDLSINAMGSMGMGGGMDRPDSQGGKAQRPQAETEESVVPEQQTEAAAAPEEQATPEASAPQPPEGATMPEMGGFGGGMPQMAT